MKLCQYKWIPIYIVLILSIISLYVLNSHKCPPEKKPSFYRNGIHIGVQCKSNWESQF